MDNSKALLELLIGNTERLSDQNTKITDKLYEIDKTLIRLTDTVVIHEKRSTTLEAIQKECKMSCDFKIEANREIAESTQNALSSITLMGRTIALILTVIAGSVGVAAGVAQIVDYFTK